MKGFIQNKILMKGSVSSNLAISDICRRMIIYGYNLLPKIEPEQQLVGNNCLCGRSYNMII